MLSMDYVFDGPAVMTGPIQGTVTCADGTVYDVSPMIIGVRDDDHAREVAHLVSMRYVDEGHPAVPGQFEYDPPEEFKEQ